MTMTRYASILLGFFISFGCSNGAVAVSLSVEEQLRQLSDSYMEMKEQLAAKDERLEALEVQVMEQKSILNALQQGQGTQVVAADRQQATSTIPRSCADLKCIGQTLSGVYSIMGAKSVEMVYCDFSKTINDAGFQKWLGYVDVKSYPVYFYVQKNNIYSTLGGPIPFELERINVGGAMNLSSGVFTAPRAGTYFFSFVGEVGFRGPSVNVVAIVVVLQVNGRNIGSGHATESNTSTSTMTQLALQSTLILKAGDQVCLSIDFMNNAYLYDNPYDQRFNHFTGWLLEENLTGVL